MKFETGHRRWVKISHWVVTISFLLLAFTGFEILMVHPRLYWGEAGNDLMPALLELPISRNHKHEGWGQQTAFFESPDSPVSAPRTVTIFNQNGWGRSLHFLAGWILVATGTIYLLFGFFTGHFRHNIWPKLKELSPKILWQELLLHFRMKIHPATNGPIYNVLQKIAYMSVIFFFLPLTIITGFTMAPAITAAYPFLMDLFGGYQSARTIHFFSSAVLEVFLIVHIIMIIKSGFKQQIRFMTLGK